MSSIEETVTFRIALACRAHRNLAVAKLAQAGLYIGQELILVQLWKEEGLTQSCLAERVGVDISTMTKSLQRLEHKGLIERHTDPNDNRALLVCLTDQGRALQPVVTNIWNEIEERTLHLMTTEERELLAKLLQRIELDFS